MVIMQGIPYYKQKNTELELISTLTNFDVNINADETANSSAK